MKTLALLIVMAVCSLFGCTLKKPEVRSSFSPSTPQKRPTNIPGDHGWYVDENNQVVAWEYYK